MFDSDSFLVCFICFYVLGMNVIFAGHTTLGLVFVTIAIVCQMIFLILKSNERSS